MSKINEKELERILKALANKRRLAALRFVKTKKSVCVTDIASHLRLSIKATSKHLTLMTAVGILEKEQVSKVVFVSLSPTMPKISFQTLTLL